MKKDGIKLEFTEVYRFTHNQIKQYFDGETNLNAFQHYNFLNNWNKENGKDLVAIADTYISQSAFTPGKRRKKTSTLKWKKSQIRVKSQFPNDATNESVVPFTFFNPAGLIKLDVSGTELATIANIKENQELENHRVGC